MLCQKGKTKREKEILSVIFNFLISEKYYKFTNFTNL